MTQIINQLGAITQVVTVPENYEIYQPFQVSGTGDILAISDEYTRAVQHLLAIAFTLPGERVMRPTYGLGVQGLVFQNVGLIQMQAVAQNLQTAYTNTDDAYVVIGVEVVQSPVIEGAYAFSVSFTIDQSPTVHQAVFDAAGNLVGST